MTTPLITRLEEAAEGSRELDAEISQALMFPTMLRWGDHHWRRGHVGGWTTLPSFTTSIDAALALAERLGLTRKWNLWQGSVSGYVAQFEGDEYSAAPTPALAFCLAILRTNHKDKP